MGNHDKAIADCTQAIRLDSKNIIPYLSRASAYGKKGDFDTRYRRLYQGDSVNPQSARTYYGARPCLRKEG